MGTALKVKFALFYNYSCVGVCEIPQCSYRTPLQNHLCRIDLEDECFLYIASNAPPGDTGVCVPECPFGTEEGNNYDTKGLFIINFFFFRVGIL
jgi:hypothetical protein